jgi:hypothetical protein
MDVGFKDLEGIFDWSYGIVLNVGGYWGPRVPIDEVTSLRLNLWLVSNYIRIQVRDELFQYCGRRGIKQFVCFLH